MNNVRISRIIKYSRKKEDNSYEDKRLNIDNDAFIDMLCDDSLHIIF